MYLRATNMIIEYEHETKKMYAIYCPLKYKYKDEYFFKTGQQILCKR